MNARLYEVGSVERTRRETYDTISGEINYGSHSVREVQIVTLELRHHGWPQDAVIRGGGFQMDCAWRSQRSTQLALVTADSPLWPTFGLGQLYRLDLVPVP